MFDITAGGLFHVGTRLMVQLPMCCCQPALFPSSRVRYPCTN